MSSKDSLSPEARQLLIAFVNVIANPNSNGLNEVLTGALLAVKAKILTEHSQNKPDYCTEQECIKAKKAIMQLIGKKFITPRETSTLSHRLQKEELPFDGKGMYWPWLINTSFSLTEEGRSHAEYLSSPKHKKIGNYCKEHIWHIIPAITGIFIFILSVNNITCNPATVPYKINDYTLTYTVGDNGFIEGAALQTVEQGDDGTQVRAVSDEGYYFNGWSDGVETATRTDTNVKGDIIVTANFAVATDKNR